MKKKILFIIPSLDGGGAERVLLNLLHLIDYNRYEIDLFIGIKGGALEAEIPDEVKIQIMTVSGRVVREITIDELGPLKIGRNITDYAWDGTDRYGDKLANGLYIYKVFTRLNGESLKQYKTNADKFFANDGFGKMYIVR